MRKSILIFLGAILSMSVVGQISFYSEDDTITIEVTSIDFVDSDHGWIVGHTLDYDYYPWPANPQFDGDCYILSTSNGGRNWKYHTIHGAISDFCFIDVEQGWAIIEDIPNEIAYSENSGETWTYVKDGSMNTDYNSLVVVDDTCLFVTIIITGTNYPSGRIIKSKDGGVSWDDFTPEDDRIDFNDIFFISSDTGVVNGDKTEYDVILSTNDGGLTWETMNTKVDFRRFNFQMIDRYNGFFLSGLDLYFTQDNYLSYEKIAEYVHDYKVIDSSSIFVLTDSSVYQLSISKTIANETSIGQGFEFIDFADHAHGWIVGQSDTLLYTDNAGETWSEIKFEVNNSISSQLIPDTHDLNVYPNPVLDKLNVKTNFPQKCFLEIHSPNGSFLYSKEIVDSGFQLDLSSFDNGVYFITIRSGESVTTRKIIKL